MSDAVRSDKSLFRRLTRREFFPFSFKIGALALIGSKITGLLSKRRQALAADAEPRVVRILHNQATSWDYSSGYYWDFVNQSVVNQMVDRGVMSLTNQPSAFAAWQRIMASYTPGDKVAIKINCNGNQGPVINHVIDACIEPINSVIRGLVSIGIPQSAIYVYDAVRDLHERYKSRIQASFPNVNVMDAGDATFGLTGDPDERIAFRNQDMEALYIADILINCQHLINIPILKSHCIGVTGALKNHVGSQCTHSNSGSCTPEPIHQYFDDSVTDLNNNPHVREKTRLIVADGLFGNWSHCVIDYGVMVGHPWLTLGNGAPNAMFLSFDPVALDSVMQDIIKTETDARGIRFNDAEHLHCAEAMGLGIHDHEPYTKIDYRSLDISDQWGCFIATAVYGSRTCNEVVVLRSFRDEYLMSRRVGRLLVALYYKCGPRLAAIVTRNDRVRRFVKEILNRVVVLIQGG